MGGKDQHNRRGTKLLKLQLHLIKIWNQVTIFLFVLLLLPFFSSIFTQLTQKLFFFILGVLAMTLSTFSAQS